jgi:hypothetical protein
VISQMIHSPVKVTVRIDHFSGARTTGPEFWCLKHTCIMDNGFMHESSVTFHKEPTALIALFGVENDHTLFELPQEIAVLG